MNSRTLVEYVKKTLVTFSVYTVQLVQIFDIPVSPCADYAPEALPELEFGMEV